MMTRPLVYATIVGTVLQLAMVVAGHLRPPVRDFFAVGGMGFSFVAGVVYARLARSAWGDSLTGGAVAGGVCGLIGIAASFALGDVPAMLMAFGTVASIVTGVIGAVAGKVSVRA